MLAGDKNPRFRSFQIVCTTAVFVVVSVAAVFVVSVAAVVSVVVVVALVISLVLDEGHSRGCEPNTYRCIVASP